VKESVGSGVRNWQSGTVNTTKSNPSKKPSAMDKHLNVSEEGKATCMKNPIGAVHGDFGLEQRRLGRSTVRW